MCAFSCLSSRPQLRYRIQFKYFHETLFLSQKLRYFRVNRFSQCFILSTALNCSLPSNCHANNYFELSKVSSAFKADISFMMAPWIWCNCVWFPGYAIWFFFFNTNLNCYVFINVLWIISSLWLFHLINQIVELVVTFKPQTADASVSSSNGFLCLFPNVTFYL